MIPPQEISSRTAFPKPVRWSNKKPAGFILPVDAFYGD
jgi:hypothetical protein